jgi:hypothetical protein
MIIKNGYGDKDLKIRVNPTSFNSKVGEFWIEFAVKPKEETLSYITLEELLNLRDEINKTIKEIVGI